MLKYGKEKQSRKAELKKAISCAEEIYWYQLTLPVSQRDSQLMAECLDTIRYSSDLLYKKTKRAASFVFRRLLVSVCSLVLILGLSTTIAYAAGVDLLSIFIGNGYVSFSGHSETGSPISSELPVDNAGDIIDGNGELAPFGSLEEAKSKLFVNPLILDLTNTDLIGQNISGAVGTAMTTLYIGYSNADGAYLDYLVNVFDSKQSAFDHTVQSTSGAYSSVEVNGITCYLTDNDTETVAVFSVDDCFYQINTSISRELLVELLGTLHR